MESRKFTPFVIVKRYPPDVNPDQEPAPKGWVSLKKTMKTQIKHVARFFPGEVIEQQQPTQEQKQNQEAKQHGMQT